MNINAFVKNAILYIKLISYIIMYGGHVTYAEALPPRRQVGAIIKYGLIVKIVCCIHVDYLKS